MELQMNQQVFAKPITKRQLPSQLSVIRQNSQKSVNSSRKSVSQCHSPLPFSANYKTVTTQTNSLHHPHKKITKPHPIISRKLADTITNASNKKLFLNNFAENHFQTNLFPNRSLLLEYKNQKQKKQQAQINQTVEKRSEQVIQNPQSNLCKVSQIYSQNLDQTYFQSKKSNQWIKTLPFDTSVKQKLQGYILQTSSLLSSPSKQFFNSRKQGLEQENPFEKDDKSFNAQRYGIKNQAKSTEFTKKQRVRTLSNYQQKCSQSDHKRISDNQQRVIQLKQRIKNLHFFYKLRIDQLTQKNMQKSQSILAVLDDLRQLQNIKKKQFERQIKEKKMQNDTSENSFKLLNFKAKQLERQAKNSSKNLQTLRSKNRQLEQQKRENQIRIKIKKEMLSKIKKNMNSLQEKIQTTEKLKERSKK